MKLKYMYIVHLYITDTISNKPSVKHTVFHVKIVRIPKQLNFDTTTVGLQKSHHVRTQHI